MSDLTIPFWKMEATGNDFIYLPELPDSLIQDQDKMLKWLRMVAPTLCHRHTGIGGDGILWTRPGGSIESPKMGFLNPDGSDAGMCGNGGRCFAAIHPKAHQIEVHGVHYPVHHLSDNGPSSDIALTFPGDVTVEKKPPFDALEHLGAVFQVFTGTEHAVVCYPASVEELHALRHHRYFQPKGTNASECLHHESGLSVRTFERGVEALTRSCGTGVVACALAWWSNQPFDGDSKTDSVRVHTDGGTLIVGAKRTGPTTFTSCTLQGAAGKRFDGSIALPLPT